MRDLQHISILYWAGAKAAAGIHGEDLAVDGPVSLSEIISKLSARHRDAHLERVLGVCSALVDGRRVSHSEQSVHPGETVEFLPPFAGG
ncbi:MAG: MoaD/ThiS family protein [Nocardioides sp.]